MDNKNPAVRKGGKTKTTHWYAACTFCYFGAAGILSTFYYPFLQQVMGLELGEISRVTSFGAVFSLVSQPLLGGLFSSSRNKKRFMQCYFTALLILAALFMVIQADQIYIFAVFYGSIAIPLIGTYEIYIENIAAVQKFAYAKVRKWGSIGMGTIALLGSTMIAAFSFRGFYLFGVGYLLLCMVLVHKYYPDIPKEKGNRDRLSFRSLFSNKRANVIYLMSFVGIGSYVGCDFAYSTYLSTMCDSVQTANQLFSFSTGIKIFLEFAAFLVIGRLSLWRNLKRNFLLVFVFSGVRFLLLSSGMLPLVIVGDMLHVLVFPLFLTLIFPCLRLLVPDYLVAGCYSIVSVLMFGVSNLIFPLLFSAVAEGIGYQVMYGVAAALSILTLGTGKLCLDFEPTI